MPDIEDEGETAIDDEAGENIQTEDGSTTPPSEVVRGHWIFNWGWMGEH